MPARRVSLSLSLSLSALCLFLSPAVSSRLTGRRNRFFLRPGEFEAMPRAPRRGQLTSKILDFCCLEALRTCSPQPEVRSERVQLPDSIPAPALTCVADARPSRSGGTPGAATPPAFAATAAASTRWHARVRREGEPRRGVCSWRLQAGCGRGGAETIRHSRGSDDCQPAPRSDAT